jgi:hypothetical protein
LSLGFCNHSPPCPRGGLHRQCAPGSPAPAPLRSPPSTFLSVGGGCSRISSFGTPQGAHHRRLQLQWWSLPDLPPAPPRGPAINVFSFDGDPCRTCRQHPPGGPPSTSSTSVVVAAVLAASTPRGPTIDVFNFMVLRHFHRCCYRSSSLWFFYWRGFWSLGR